LNILPPLVGPGAVGPDGADEAGVGRHNPLGLELGPAPADVVSSALRGRDTETRVEPTDRRRSLLVSTLVHLVALLLLVQSTARSPTRPTPEPDDESAAPVVRQRVYLPPLRRAAPARPQPPAPTPPPQVSGKERISVGGPSDQRQRELILRREDDLTKTARGTAAGVAGALPEPPVAQSSPPPNAPANPGGRVQPPTGLDLRPGSGSLARGREAQPGPSLAGALRDIDRRLERMGALGTPSGTGQQIGPLFFDPQGADFTVWMNQFKNEVYRNWIVPQPALMGFRGHVDIEFTVERDGSLSSLRVLNSSGTVSLDRAAENALRGSRFLSLPADFAPARVTMRAIFYYNEAPRAS
jgi:protein TonB